MPNSIVGLKRFNKILVDLQVPYRQIAYDTGRGNQKRNDYIGGKRYQKSTLVKSPWQTSGRTEF